MPKRVRQLVFFSFLIIFLGILASPALALELRYPSLPGIGALKQAQELEGGPQLVFYVKYFVNLAFFVVAGVCLIVLIGGGVLYIAASQKAELVARATEMVKQAFLGLFILLASYLLLYAINPQLLSLEIKKPALEHAPVPETAGEIKPTVTYTSFGLEPVKWAVEDLSGQVDIDPETGEITETFSPSAWQRLKAGLLAALTGSGSQTQTVYRVEVPFIKATKKIEKALALTQEIDALLEKCKCGMSKFHLKRKALLDYVCQGGVDEAEKSRLIRELKEEAAQAGEELQEGQLVCLMQSDDCGTAKDAQGNLTCDLREVRETKDENDPADETDDTKLIEIEAEKDQWKKIETYYFDSTTGKWQWETEPLGGTPAQKEKAEAYKASSIKYKRLKLQAILAELQSQKPVFSIEQIGSIAKTLKINVIEFLLGETQQGSFWAHFEPLEKAFKQKNIQVKVVEPEQFSVPGLRVLTPTAAQSNRFVKAGAQEKNFFSLVLGTIQTLPQLLSKSVLAVGEVADLVSAARFFYPVGVENYPALAALWELDIKINKEAEEKARGANLFSVLAGLTLEEIEAIFEDCLVSAFGEADYELPGNVAEIIRSAIRQGTADFLVLQLARNSPEFARLIGEAIIEDITNDISLTLEKECAVKECGCSEYCALQDKQCFQAFMADRNNEECVKKCKKQNIPPNFLSSKLGQLFTEPLKKRLPEELEKLLDKELREVIFGDPDSDINKALSSEMAELYDKILQGALKRSFTEQIPVLKGFLETNIGEFVRDHLESEFIDKIDFFLNNQIPDLREVVNKETEDLAEHLKTVLTDGIAEGAGWLKEQMPTVFTEYLPMEECFTRLGKGYLFKCDDDPEGKCENLPYTPEEMKVAPGKCVQLRPEEINTLERAITGDFTSGLLWFNITQEKRKEICEGAGYCWSQDWEIDNIWEGFQKGDWLCGDCQWVGQNILAEVKGVNNLEELKDLGVEAAKKTLAGFVNYFEQLAVALTETIMHTALAYAQVWLEDTVLIPLEPYIKQVTGFQERLRGFLNSTVANILPAQIVNTLNSNIEEILADICHLGDPANDNKFTLDLYANKTWGEKFEVTVSPKVISEACRITDHLQNTLLVEIKSNENLAKIGAALETKIIDFAGDTVRKYLNMTPAQIIFEQYGLENVVELIQGTPKQLLCGEIALQKKEWTAVNRKPRDVCQLVTDQQQKLLAQVSKINEDKLRANTASEEERAFYRFYCPTRYWLCDAPLPGVTLPKTIGGATAEIMSTACNVLDKAVTEADPDHIFTCANLGDPGFPAQYKYPCYFCNVKDDSLASIVFHNAISAIFGPLGAAGPYAAEEREAYQWLLSVFPALESEIQKVAVERGFGGEWASLIQELKSDAELNDLERIVKDPAFSPGGQRLFLVFVYWLTHQTKYEEIFLSIPLGVIKPFKQGEATLLREVGQGATVNFLSETPFGFVRDEVCPKIEKEFTLAYPFLTLEALQMADIAQLRDVLPYSLESVETLTIAKRIETVLNANIDEGLKDAYLFCKSLDLTPAQILGLDQLLKSYLRPKEYIILFDLIKNELYEYERPPALNALLNYLYEKTPVSALGDVATILESEGLQEEADKIRNVAEFLNQNIISYLNKDWMAQRMLDTIWEAFCKESYPGNTQKIAECQALLKEKLGWEKWQDIQEFFLMTPMDFLTQRLDRPFPIQGSFPGLEPLMKYLEERTFLGQPYVDTLGRRLGLDVFAWNLFEAKEQYVDKYANRWIQKGQEAIQGAMETVFIEAPKAIAEYVGSKLAAFIGKDTGEEIVRKCWEVADASRCDTNKGQVFRQREGKNECCQMSGGMVCEPQCRLLGTKECRESKGEEQVGANRCCYDDECRKCRRPLAVEMREGGCKREGETKETKGNLAVCCRKRTKTPLLGPPLPGQEPENLCCVTIVECVTEKFLDHLDLLKDYIIDGPPLNKLID